MNIFTEPTYQEARPILAHKLFDLSPDRIAANTVLVGQLPRLVLDECPETSGQASSVSASWFGLIFQGQGMINFGVRFPVREQAGTLPVRPSALAG